MSRIRYHKKWKLPVGKNYHNLCGWDRVNRRICKEHLNLTILLLPIQILLLLRLNKVIEMILLNRIMYFGYGDGSYQWTDVIPIIIAGIKFSIDNTYINNNDNEKWHVIDIMKSITDNTYMDVYYFRDENKFY